MREVFPDLPDVAGIPARLQKQFPFAVLLPGDAPSDGGFDHGRDEISKSIRLQGVWECQETAVVLDVLSRTTGLVLDFGAHVGWYTVLAGLFGHPVWAIEENQPTIEVLRKNLELNAVEAEVIVQSVNDVSELPSLPSHVALMKSDLESQDCNAVRMCEDLFVSQSIDFALIEVSPIFTREGRGSGCDYLELLERLIGYGYEVFLIPPKGWVHNNEYREAPLATLRAHCRVEARSVLDWRQENILLALPE